MDKKTWDILRTALGVYLIWLGISLLIQVTEEKPRDMALMSSLAVIFVFVGLGYALYHLDKIFDLKKRFKIFAFQKKQKEEKDFVTENHEDIKTKLHIMPSSEETKLLQEEEDAQEAEKTSDEKSELTEESENRVSEKEPDEEFEKESDKQSEENNVFQENNDTEKETVLTESREEEYVEEEGADEETETYDEEIEKDYEEK